MKLSRKKNKLQQSLFQMKNDILNKPIIHIVRRKNAAKTQQGRKKKLRAK